jgi:hypothetical protein
MSTTDDFDILDWIETGTVAERSVIIYNDPALVGQFERLERDLKAAERAKESGTGEESVGDEDPVAAVLRQMKALAEQWEASKATWWVRGLAPEDIDAVVAQFPDPPAPEIPAGVPLAKRAELMRPYLVEQKRIADERNLHHVAKAVIRVETARGTAHGISVDALRKMRARPHGPSRLSQLIEAVNEATNGDVEIAVPNSRSSSETSPN